MDFRFFNFQRKKAAPLQPTEFYKELVEIAHVGDEIGKASDTLKEKKPDREKLEKALQHLINAQRYDEMAIVSSSRIWEWLSNAPQEAISPTDRHMLLIFGKEPPLQIKRYIATVRLALKNCNNAGYMRGEAWHEIIFKLGRRLIHDIGFLHYQLLMEQHYLKTTGMPRSSPQNYRVPWYATSAR